MTPLEKLRDDPGLEPKILPCTKCGVEKPVSEFYKSKRSNRRRQYVSWCKQCKRVYADKVKEKDRYKRYYARTKNKNRARKLARKEYSGKTFVCGVLTCYATADALHHHNYDDPLAVIPLCRRHHYELHENSADVSASGLVDAGVAEIRRREVEPLKKIRDAAADLMNNFEKCSQNPSNVTFIAPRYRIALTEALLAYDEVLKRVRGEE